MAFDYVGSGAPTIPSPGNFPATYLDKSNGVVYVSSAQGWKEDLFSAADNLTAHAGGGQASATPITTQMARFATVATLNDSAVLPVSVAGMSYSVANAGANGMNVFAAVGDKMNGTLNGSQAIAAGKSAEFFCCSAGNWHVILSA